ncbi:hypothetical protein MICRO8M_20156 [Microbacterium sp. 8M]|nr:hypothetical protein MICRO8M_20156 [Microbacterium sp. 8M]
MLHPDPRIPTHRTRCGPRPSGPGGLHAVVPGHHHGPDAHRGRPDLAVTRADRSSHARRRPERSVVHRPRGVRRPHLRARGRARAGVDPRRRPPRCGHRAGRGLRRRGGSERHRGARR